MITAHLQQCSGVLIPYLPILCLKSLEEKVVMSYFAYPLNPAQAHATVGDKQFKVKQSKQAGNTRIVFICSLNSILADTENSDTNYFPNIYETEFAMSENKHIYAQSWRLIV